jgi:hypothetical protein|tara:strand:+ start:433 stop:765 length:333 start_codon:yes stop_codon:yes gene_type:complete
MKLKDLIKDIELGKVYTDKDKPSFQVNEAKITVGGNKFLVSVKLRTNLEINLIPTKILDDEDKAWNMLEKHLKKKLKFKDITSYKYSDSAGFTFTISKYDVEDWLAKLIK